MDIKIRTFKGYWSEADAINHPTWLFVFGDNDIKKGCKGQVEEVSDSYETSTNVRKPHISISSERRADYTNKLCERSIQAIIRNCSNAVGIPTKKYPSLTSTSFYADVEYKSNCKKIDNAIDNIMLLLKTKKYTHVVLPEDGLGTGLAKLPQRAPKTYKYLNKVINDLHKNIE